MGQAKQRGTKEQRVAEGIAKREQIEAEVKKLMEEQDEQRAKWNEDYEAGLPYRERTARHNTKVMLQALMASQVKQ